MQYQADDDTRALPKKVLLLEDDELLAKYFAKILVNSGVEDVIVSHNNASALSIIEKDHIDAAFIDVGLVGETSEITAQILTERKIPFAFLSGRGLPDFLQEKYPHAAVLVKPAKKDDVNAVLSKLGSISL